jgi:hypothetical protein
MAFPMQVVGSKESPVARNTAEAEQAPRVGEVEGAKLDPIGVVKRKLTSPDGSTVVVEVPVYPPFQLADRPSNRKPPVRSRSAPSLKRKRTSSPDREAPAE